MARKIRFPLRMKNGTEVRTLDELKENFDLESVLGYFTDGKLQTWLADRYEDEKAEAVAGLSADTPDLNAKLCEILEVEYKAEADETDLEYIRRRNEKLKILGAVTADQDILKNIDLVAMDQDELYDILYESPENVYLYGEKFEIPFGRKNICYLGINMPLVILENNKYIYNYEDAGIVFRNVKYEGNVNPHITFGEKLYIEGNYKEAFPLIEKAANNGNPRAMYILAMSYKDGTGVEINNEKCKEWLSKANGLNEPLSMMNYAYWCCKSDNERKMSILSQYSNQLKEMADSGDTLAEFEYGDYLISYSDEDEKAFGIAYLLNAAMKEFVPAQNYLGNIALNGNLMEQDYAVAFEWYSKAAGRGYAKAQCNLGDMYYNGNGIEKNYEKAADWYGEAAEQGLLVAKDRLRNFHDERCNNVGGWPRDCIIRNVAGIMIKYCTE